MESIEIAVYFAVALIIGVMVVGTIKVIDHRAQYRKYVDVMKGDDEDYKITADQFSFQLAKRWEACRFGIDNISYSLYVTDNATINREQIVLQLRRDDKCDVIDCWNKTNELIVNGPIITPKIINIQCFNNTLIVN